MNKKTLLGGLLVALLVAAACSKPATTNTTTTNTTTTNTSTANRATTPPPASNTSNTSTTNTSTSNTAAAPPAGQEGGKQDFTLVNNTGIEIDQLYVAPHTDAEWNGDTDILGRDTLPNGESVDIIFSPKEKAAMWDMKIVDTNGKAVEWNNLNLLEISKITLRIENGQPVARTE